MLEIRKATLDNISLIRQLNLQIWPQTYSSILSGEQIDYMLELMYSAESLRRQMTMEKCTFLLIYDDGNPVGFASFSEEEPGSWKLHKIYVLPGQQGKGTGKFFLEHILAEIPALGAHRLLLQVNRFNKARDFYEKMGFSIIDSGDFDIGNGFYMNDYIMEKKVP